MPPIDAAERQRRIAAALAARRAEVERDLGAATPTDEHGDLPPESPDPEEALRLVMVRLWPALAGSTAGSRELGDLLGGLLTIRTPARGADLRFLDAWNNAYEALLANPGLAATPPARRLLVAYADILSGQLERLAA